MDLVEGSTDVNQPGSSQLIFPMMDVLYVKNTPGGRFGVGSWKQDSFDYFWIVGGEGIDVGGRRSKRPFDVPGLSETAVELHRRAVEIVRLLGVTPPRLVV